MHHRWNTALVATLVAAPLAAQQQLAAPAATPAPLLAYQGRLLEATLPVTGTRTFAFALLDATGTELWNSGAQPVSVNSGLYGVELGAAPMPAIPTSVLAQPNLKLRVVVSGITLAPDTDLVPALQARSAFEVSGAFAGDIGGTQNAITLLRLQGIPLDLTTTAPVSGQALVYNGSAFVPGTVTGAQGPAGPQGVAGPTGATGPAGPQGLQGLTGAAGIAGPAGAVGANGINGLDGRTVRNGVGTPAAALGVDGDFYLNTATNMLYGPKGSAIAGQWPATGISLVGPQGMAGLTGAQGLQGAAGTTGAAGVQGPSGATGPQGLQGLTGATGPQGSMGPQGLPGLTGATGASGAQGPAGIAGVNGKTILSGAGSPAAAGTIGTAGDFYLDTLNNLLYGPRFPDPIGWVGAAVVALVGPQGLPGATGATGPQGVAGATGPQGLLGPTGLQGPAGASPFTLSGNNALFTTGSVCLGTNNSFGYRLAVVGGITTDYAVLPGTTGAFQGTLRQGGTHLLHTYGSASNYGDNFFVGYGAGNFTLGGPTFTQGSMNTGLGNATLVNLTTGSYNTAGGNKALLANTTGNSNTAFGASSLTANTLGSNNAAMGQGSLAANTLGSDNTAIGLGSLTANTTAGGNVAVGTNALANQSFSNNGVAYNSWNTAVGDLALSSNQPTVTLNGNWNTAVGGRALAMNITGWGNTAVGMQCLDSSTTGSQNSALGNQALIANNTGSSNTAMGWAALAQSTTANFNTALGATALEQNTTASYNTAIGYQALQGNTTGWPNNAFGAGALMANTTGGGNTALGNGALARALTGSNNIAIGPNAGYNLTGAESNNLHIGHAGVTGDSGVIRIGSGSQTTAFMTGIRGVTTAVNNAIPVVIDSNGQLGTISSSIRFKEQIQDLATVSGRIHQLRPVSFHYKGQSGNAHFGLIAEEVDMVMPELAVRGRDGQIETVAYHELPPLLLAEMQKQQKALEALKAENDDLKAQLAEIRALLKGR